MKVPKELFTRAWWLNEHATAVLIALLNAGRDDLAISMCTEAFGMSPDDIKAALDESDRREAEGR